LGSNKKQKNEGAKIEQNRRQNRGSTVRKTGKYNENPPAGTKTMKANFYADIRRRLDADTEQ